MKISISPATEPMLSQLRSEYLDYLYEPQDMHSESLNRCADSHFLWNGDETFGYVLTAGAGTLVEFYVRDERLAALAFDHVIDAKSIKQAICKTFDPVLLSLCLGRAAQAKPIAFHFVTIADEGFRVNQAITIHAAEAFDIASIMEINDDFFDSDEEVNAYIGKGQLVLYKEKNELLGCGLVQPVRDGRPAYDLGMIVNSSRRREGIGQYIVRHLKADCLSKGLRPICCCDIENLASRGCLEAAGFRSRHRTVEFSL